MHNLKEIRKNFDDFKDALKSRFLKVDFNEIKDLDIKNRNFIQKKLLPFSDSNLGAVGSRG